MDSQLEFLQEWASVCQPMIDKFVEKRRVLGFEKAYGWWVDKNNRYLGVKGHEAHHVVGTEFEADMMLAAMIYIDLMIRWGCLDDE